ncbi:unnamed protein product [Peronospora destructor]|uniref:Secreted protein n=1 Tax=Peronospora destructor TaxID=86335 RepID=A0AAV0VE34_9STRA|nr:unnamed protein product [Peronospora destructor]
MRVSQSLVWIAVVPCCWAARSDRPNENQLTTQSGLKMWVDPETPQEKYTWETSRGEIFQIELEESVIQLQVWNSYLSTPGFENVTFFYRGAKQPAN